MSGLIRKSLDSPEEVRKFEGETGRLELVNLDAAPVGRATFKPGWKIVGDDPCVVIDWQGFADYAKPS